MVVEFLQDMFTGQQNGEGCEGRSKRRPAETGLGVWVCIVLGRPASSTAGRREINQNPVVEGSPYEHVHIHVQFWRVKQGEVGEGESDEKRDSFPRYFWN